MASDYSPEYDIPVELQFRPGRKNLAALVANLRRYSFYLESGSNTKKLSSRSKKRLEQFFRETNNDLYKRLSQFQYYRPSCVNYHRLRSEFFHEAKNVGFGFIAEFLENLNPSTTKQEPIPKFEMMVNSLMHSCSGSEHLNLRFNLGSIR